jgi:hypothetical protein
VKDLEVLRNGVALGSGGWGTELPIDPGKVEIVARAPGFLPKTKTITIQKKQHLSATIEKLDPAPVVETVAVADQGWSGKRKTGAVLFVAGVAGVGVGTYFGFSALSNRDKANEHCPTLDGEVRCDQAGSDYSKKANTAAWAANIGIGLGAVAIISGTFLFITGKNDKLEPGRFRFRKNKVIPFPHELALRRLRAAHGQCSEFLEKSRLSFEVGRFGT